MRLVARFVIGVVVVLVLTGAALFFLRKEIATAAIEHALGGAGLEKPSARVTVVSLARLTVARLEAGADLSNRTLALENVSADYDWRALLFDGKIRSLTIEGGAAVIAVDDKGAIDVAGWSPDPNAKRAPPPFTKLTIKKLGGILRTPRGDARFNLDGDFDYADGGSFAYRLNADEAGFAAAALDGATGAGTIRLAADGVIDVDGDLAGAMSTPAGAVKGLDATLAARLSSWRGIFGEGSPSLQGEASVALNSSTIDASTSPSLGQISGGGTPIRMLSVSGMLAAAFGDEGYAIRLDGGPLLVTADRGDRLEISAADGTLFESRRGVETAGLKATLTGPLARGVGELRARSENKGPWRIDADAALGGQTIGGVSISGLKAAFGGDYQDDRLTGVVDFDAGVTLAAIGRLRIDDMPARGRANLAIDLAAKLLTASPADGSCAAFARAAFRMAEQDMDARLSDASLCASGAPLLAVAWGDKTLVRMEGALTARAAHYRLGKTIFDGAPPRIGFALDYDPAAQRTGMTGDFAGGRVLLNNALVLSDAKGGFEGEIAGEKMKATAMLDILKVAQNTATEVVAPVGVSGEMAYAEDVARFDFAVKTPKGQALGTGEGAHQVRTGRGEAIFDSGLLTFTAALQPDRLVPALRGVISGATGATEGRARFDWAPDVVNSSATVNLDGVSFAGPGVAVTRTEGVAGKIVFSSLSPVATAGEQIISIRRIDLDALKLENGMMRFALPGDGTLKIVEAEFPWFSGTIGAYDSEMSITGKSETTLQIDNVDLSELLKYVKVEGLSGEGVVEGVLPISFEGGKARVNNGILSSKGQGVVRYESKTTNAASQANDPTAFAFDVLRELRFEKLAATIDGPLDGTLDFNILFEGRSDIPVKTRGGTQRVDSPVKYRVTIKAPLLSLIEQAALSTNVKLQVERAKKEQAGAGEEQ